MCSDMLGVPLENAAVLQAEDSHAVLRLGISGCVLLPLPYLPLHTHLYEALLCVAADLTWVPGAYEFGTGVPVTAVKREGLVK